MAGRTPAPGSYFTPNSTPTGGHMPGSSSSASNGRQGAPNSAAAAASRTVSNSSTSTTQTPTAPLSQHNLNLPSIDNVEPINTSRRFFPRGPVGSRPERRAAQNVDSLVSAASTRNSRASTVSTGSRPQTIRIRRLPSARDLNNAYNQPPQPAPAQQYSSLLVPETSHTRRRSASDPARHSWLGDPAARSSTIMSPVQEMPPDIPPTPPPKIPWGQSEIPPTPPPKLPLEQSPLPPVAAVPGPSRPQSTRFGSNFSINGARSLLGMRQRMEDVDRAMKQPPPRRKPVPVRKEYNQDVVDFLDVVDPEVSTLSTLTNVQNSLFIPNLGTWINRAPTYDLSSLRDQPRDSRRGSRVESTHEENEKPSPEDEMMPDGTSAIAPALQRQTSHALSITSNLTDSHYAVLPHGASIDDWTEEEKEMLDDHVRHLLHSKREKFKRGWRGFVQYVKRPMGFFVTVYATLITLFGLAWVLFLIGWIYVGEQQLYAINVIDHVLVALFAIVGDGLAPFRAVDTYHMIYIARYHYLTWKLRQKRQLPALQDRNDLPTRQFVSVEADRASVLADLEQAWDERNEDPVLSDEQQEKFEHHSMKFSKSHTYYRPHETRTHHAFPVKLLIAVTILLDFHSMFQITLGGVTWGIDYKVRPAALTAVILSCSITCNIAAGITISIGDRMTRKKRIIEQEFRQGLTEEAMNKVKKKVQKKKEKANLAGLAGKDSSTSGSGITKSSRSNSGDNLIDEKNR